MPSNLPPSASELAWQRIILRHSGRWEKAEYVDGDEQLIYMLTNQLSHDQLLREIHDVMQSDPMTIDYLLFYMTSTITDRRRIKVALKSDTDLLRMLYEDKNEPIVYIVEKSTQTRPANDAPHMHQSRTHHHANLSGQSSTSVDDNVVARGVLQKLVIPDIEIVAPSKIVEPLTENDGGLFVGAIFDSKHSLKIEVKTHHMKNRVKYSVERSSSDRVNFICKYGNGCPFMLRARSVGGIWRIIKLNKDHTCKVDLDRIQ